MQLNAMTYLGILLLLGVFDTGHARAQEPSANLGAMPFEQGSERVVMDLFVMSLCPYGMQAQNALLPLARQFADRVDLRIHYIADEAGADAKPPFTPDLTGATARAGCAATNLTGDGPFLSLHGQEEIDESRRQLIVLDQYPTQYSAYLLCRSRSGPAGDWRICARAVGIDPDSLQTQALSQRGTDLFRANITLANSLGIDLSPTLMIEGEDRTEWLGNPALTRLLCAADDARCKNLPTCSRDADCSAATGQVALCENPNKPQARCTSYTPIPFDLHAIHTNACPSCDMENFLETTRKLFPAAKIHHHDAAGDSGAFLAQKYSLQVFPAYILSADFVRSPRFARVRHMVESRADAYALSPRLSGRSFWPRRLPQPGQLELFLPAWDIESEVQFLHLGETTPLQIHYLLDGAPAGAQSEFAVRACIGMHSPERLASFVATRNLERRRGSALGQWLNAARDSGVLSAAIDHCIHTGSGDRLLARGAARADSLDLRGDAPAVLVQNQLLVRRPQPAEVVQIWQEKR